jgi:predicted kinase
MEQAQTRAMNGQTPTTETQGHRERQKLTTKDTKSAPRSSRSGALLLCACLCYKRSMANRTRGRGGRRKKTETGAPQQRENAAPALPPLRPTFPGLEESPPQALRAIAPETHTPRIVESTSLPGRAIREPQRTQQRAPQPSSRRQRPNRATPQAAGRAEQHRPARGEQPRSIQSSQPELAAPVEQGGAGRAQQPRRTQRRGRRGRGRGGRQRGAAESSTTPAVTPVSEVSQPQMPGAVTQEWPAALALPEAEQLAPLQPAAPTTAPAFAPELHGERAIPAPAQRAPKGVVVLTIGLPGSGKSTWFKRRGVTPLSSDMLRTVLFDDITEQRYQHLVFSTLRSLLRARLIARMPWNYVDATNLSSHDRRQWIQMARSFGYEVHAVFFDVPLEVCMERNSRRERQVPEDAMRRLAAKLGPPKFEEGFAKITVVRVKQPHAEA